MLNNLSNSDFSFSLDDQKLIDNYILDSIGEEKKVIIFGEHSSELEKLLKNKKCHVSHIQITSKNENDRNIFSYENFESLELEKIINSEKYDVIVLYDLIHKLSCPEYLLNNLIKFLNPSGTIIVSAPNASHGSIRLQLFDGDFGCLNKLMHKNSPTFYTSDSIPKLLSKTGFSLTTLDRIKSDIFSNNTELKSYIIHPDFINSLLHDPDSTTSQFVFSAIPTNNKTFPVHDSLSDFPKSFAIEKLSNMLQAYNDLIIEQKKVIESSVTKIEVEDAPKSIVEDAPKSIVEDAPKSIDGKSLFEFWLRYNSKIEEYNSKIKTLDANLLKIKELKLRYQNAQNMLKDIHQSFVFRTLKKFDNTIGKIIPLKPKKYISNNDVLPTIEDEQIRIEKTIIENSMKCIYEKKDIICFGIIPWSYRIQRPQHILTEFAKKGHRIFYFKPEIQVSRRDYEITQIQDNIFEVSFTLNSFFDLYRESMDSLTISLLSDKFKKLKNDLNIDGVCLVQFPGWAELVLELKNLFNYKVIFDILDDFTEFPNIPKTRIIQEKLLAQNSDIVLTTSSILEEKAKTFSENVLFLPNACEFSHFNKSINDNFLGNYKKPIIGYFGAIAEWFDVELIEYVVRNRPDFSYVFIGLTAGANIRKLEKYENVHFLGEHAYSELPNYLHGFDACLIPFKRNKLIESTHPVKIYEYLSAGKPTICTNLPELNSMKNLCYIANDKEEFLRMLDSALNEKDKNIIKKRIDFSSKNTWHDRFTKLYDNMEKIPDLRLDEHIKQIK